MTRTRSVPRAAASPAPFTPAMLLLFAGSGCAALLYEVVWFHLLRLVVGCSSVSIAFLLASFMGGMCLGTLLLPRCVGRHRHPLLVYALLELGIGAIGLLLPVALPWLGDLYQQHAGSGMSGLAWRGTLCGVVLLLPTMLMGATLPAIARWLDTTTAGMQQLGGFYVANLVGAVAGTVLAGFWLMPCYDLVVTTGVAVAINALVALVALGLARRGCAPAVVPAPSPAAAAPLVRSRAVHVAIALSGASALGAEVVWTRLLSLLFGATVYTFSLILAVFLVGLGVGSGLATRRLARTARPRAAFAGCQLLLVPALAWSAYAITAIIPFGEPTHLFSPAVYQNMPLHYGWDVLRCLFAIGPATVLWGASFPLAVAAAGGSEQDAGRLVAGVYAANTLGAIVGALGVGLFAIGGLGSQGTQQVLVLVAATSACLLLASAAPRGAGRGRAWARALGGAAVGALFVALVAPVPYPLLAFGRQVARWPSEHDYLFTAEGVNSSVAITALNRDRYFHVNGRIEASTELTDMRLQRLLGHLPALAHPAPRSVLVVGCGAGVTAGCFVDHPSIERIVICELEPQVPAGVRVFLRTANRSVLDDPRTQLVIDDARHFLATTREQFDIITSDPVHPWVRGAASLYSAEYYRLVRAHLNAGGVVTQWVPFYETDAPSVKSQIATFVQAFPETTVWSSDPTGKGYDVVLMARPAPSPIDVDALGARIAANAPLAEMLAEAGLGGAIPLLRTYAGRGTELQPWLADAERNLDVNLRLQYLAGLRLDVREDTSIFADLKRFWRYPDDLFVGSAATLQQLRQALGR